MPVYKNMTREYKLGAGSLDGQEEGRCLQHYDIRDGVRISKPTFLGLPLVDIYSDPDRDQHSVSELQTDPQNRIGGGFHVSVTTGFLCVDIR